jgi:hypothetical protein
MVSKRGATAAENELMRLAANVLLLTCSLSYSGTVAVSSCGLSAERLLPVTLAWGRTGR